MAHPSEVEAHQPPGGRASVGDDMDKHDAAKVTEVQGDVHFYETVTAAPLNPWSKTSIQLYFILLVAALNATASGFDGVSAQRQLLCVVVLADRRLTLLESPSSRPSTP